MASSNSISTRVNFASSKNQFAYPDFLGYSIESLSRSFSNWKPLLKIEKVKGFLKFSRKTFLYQILEISSYWNFWIISSIHRDILLSECIERGLTYSVPLKAKLKLYCTDPEHEDFETIVQDVYLGTIPYMTPTGSFVVMEQNVYCFSTASISRCFLWSSLPRKWNQIIFSKSYSF